MTAPETPQKSGIPKFTIFVLLVALALIVIGFKNGEHRSYFQKAVMVCTQCIGLG